jgi:hypothetical protein
MGDMCIKQPTVIQTCGTQPGTGHAHDQRWSRWHAPLLSAVLISFLQAPSCFAIMTTIIQVDEVSRSACLSSAVAKYSCQLQSAVSSSSNWTHVTWSRRDVRL